MQNFFVILCCLPGSRHKFFLPSAFKKRRAAQFCQMYKEIIFDGILFVLRRSIFV